MASVGEKIRLYREELGLPQSALAEAVGTSQQTVDRIERGLVEHSRFSLPILIWIEAEYDRRNLKADISELVAHAAGRPPTDLVASFRLADGTLVEDGEIAPPHAIREEQGLFGLRLERGFQGPMGDVIFRAGDFLFVHPTQRPGHFSVCLTAAKDKPEGPFEWQVVLDRSEVPGMIPQIAEAFAWTDQSDRAFFRVAAIFPR